MFHFSQRDAEGGLAEWAGAEQVLGVPMPSRGATGRETAPSPQEALQDWLNANKIIFCGLGDADEITFELGDVQALRDGRVSLRFSQRIEDPREGGGYLPVQGVHGRSLIAKVVKDGWAVTYVSAAVLDVPTGGLSRPIVSSEAAKVIATTTSQAASSGIQYEWAEPVLEAGPGCQKHNPRAAAALWLVRGYAVREVGTAVDVLVDSHDGKVIAELPRQLFAGFATGSANQTPTVYGTVTGSALQGLNPFHTLLACTTWLAINEPLPRFSVQLLDAPNGNVVAATTTNSSGYYEFSNSLTSTSTLRFIPEHSYFKLARTTGVTASVIRPVFIAHDEDLAGQEVSAVGGGEINYHLEDSRDPSLGGEHAISHGSAWGHVHHTREFFRSRFSSNQSYAGIDDTDLRIITAENHIVTQPSDLIRRGAYYAWSGLVAMGTDPLFGNYPVLAFASEGDCECTGASYNVPNQGYSTVVSHEYGHYLLHETFGIQIESNVAIHEGYADLVAVLHLNTDIVGEAGLGCDGSTPKHYRDWDAIETIYDSATPAWREARICDPNPYSRSERLGLVWRALREQINDLSVTRQLFVDWSFLATAEPVGSTRKCYTSSSPGTASRDLSVRDATFLEVLAADDDNNILSDGTPHDAEICAAFGMYDLPTIPSSICADSARSGRCGADLDGDGVFSIQDINLFERLIEQGSLRADLNRDGMVDLFDRLEFMNQGYRCQ